MKTYIEPKDLVMKFYPNENLGVKNNLLQQVKILIENEMNFSLIFYDMPVWEECYYELIIHNSNGEANQKGDE